MRGEQIGAQWYEPAAPFGAPLGKGKKEGRAKARPYKTNRLMLENF
jgi:hypothetical protein